MLEGDAPAAYAARQIFFEETRVEVMRDWRFRTGWGDLNSLTSRGDAIERPAFS